jgi:S-adenosylmethionine decarboxylase
MHERVPPRRCVESRGPVVAREQLVDARGCDPRLLRDVDLLARILARVAHDVGATVLGTPQWHVFPNEGGVTGLVLLSESHLTVHTWPEHGHASFNLFCCRPNAAWPWDEMLRELLVASSVTVVSVPRGVPLEVPKVGARSLSLVEGHR